MVLRRLSVSLSHVSGTARVLARNFEDAQWSFLVEPGVGYLQPFFSSSLSSGTWGVGRGLPVEDSAW